MPFTFHFKDPWDTIYDFVMHLLFILVKQHLEAPFLTAIFSFQKYLHRGLFVCTSSCEVLPLKDKCKQLQLWYPPWKLGSKHPLCFASFRLNLQIQRALRNRQFNDSRDQFAKHLTNSKLYKREVQPEALSIRHRV